METIHQKPLPEIVREVVFEPLGMTRSFYKDTLPEGEENFAKCFATGVTETSPARWHVQPELGAAGVWTTPADLLRAQRGIRDAALGKNDFLSKDLALKGLTVVDGAGGFGFGGWTKGKNWFGHTGGNNPGFRCWTVMCFDDDGKGELGKAEGEGIAVMTNSALGHEVFPKMVQAIAYLRKWPGRKLVGLYDMENVAIPLRDPSGEVDGGWKQWIGAWEIAVDKDDKSVKKGQILQIMEGNQEPSVKLDDLPTLKLLKAAMPSDESGIDDRKTIDLVVDGLDMMITLRHSDDGERKVQIWPGLWEQPIDCRRSS